MVVFVIKTILAFHENFKYLSKYFDNMYLCFIVYSSETLRIFFDEIVDINNRWKKFQHTYSFF